MRRSGRRAAAGLLATLVLALVGCTAPPDGSEVALERLADRLRALPGVAAVETSLTEADPKDRPDEWIAGLDIEATESGLGIAAEVRREVSAGVPEVALQVGLRIPEGTHGAAVSLDPRLEDDVDMAGLLRGQSFAAGVDLLPWWRSVALADGAAFADAVPALRALAPTADLALVRGTTSVGVDGSSPGAALLSRIDAFAADPRVERLTSTTSIERARGSIRLTAADFDEVAGILAATADEAAEAGLRPRTSFSVTAPDYSEERSGWLGLPLGSPEPDDLALGDPPAPVIDPAEAAAALAEGESGVRAFLEAAIAASGVPAEVTTVVAPCSDASASRAEGHVVIPVFTVLDSAQEPFDAVVAGWAAEGFERTDRASGRDFWTTSAERDDRVASASIRGTTEGLSLTATAECVPQ